MHAGSNVSKSLLSAEGIRKGAAPHFAERAPLPYPAILSRRPSAVPKPRER